MRETLGIAACATIWARYELISSTCACGDPVLRRQGGSRRSFYISLAKASRKDIAQEGIIAQELQCNASVIRHIAISYMHFDLAGHALSPQRGGGEAGGHAEKENTPGRFRK